MPATRKSKCILFSPPTDHCVNLGADSCSMLRDFNLGNTLRTRNFGHFHFIPNKTSSRESRNMRDSLTRAPQSPPLNRAMREQLNFGQEEGMRERGKSPPAPRAIIHSLSYLQPRPVLSIWNRARFPDLERNPNLHVSTARVIFTSRMGLKIPCSLSVSPAATDADTRDEEVTFLISGPDCGIISLTSRPGRPLTRFTQADVKNGRVLFTHTGKKDTLFAVAGTFFRPCESKVIRGAVEVVIN